MDLSIIILNYKQKGLVKYCLKNLLSLSLPIVYEIIVVDNASADGLEAMLKNEFMSVKLVQAELNRGYASGNNLGIASAQGKYVLI
ncbi:MAG: glycosyltransferase, partial [bacterium]|nr:glycosyltransferase [bacterium]